jgi:hypothetical protein
VASWPSGTPRMGERRPVVARCPSRGRVERDQGSGARMGDLCSEGTCRSARRNPWRRSIPTSFRPPSWMRVPVSSHISACAMRQ